MHFTKDYRKFCHVGDRVDNCKLGLFQDASFNGDTQDSAFTTSGGVLCKVVNRTFVQFRKKRRAVSHSSTEAEIWMLDCDWKVCQI